MLHNGFRAHAIASVLIITALAARTAVADFPPGSGWGTAVSGFGTEMGAGDNDTGSDWWVWVHDTDNIAAGISDPGEFRADLAGKADFIVVDYYTRGRTHHLGSPLTPVLPLFDFLPITQHRAA